MLSEISRAVPFTRINPQSVSITPDAQFFGDHQDELVVLINDPAKELLRYNNTIASASHAAHDAYKKQHNSDLYAIAKSERYPYLPHMGLGRLRIQAIKNLLKNDVDAPAIIERIKKRIEKEVSALLAQIVNDKNNTLYFKTISIAALPERAYIESFDIVQ